MRFQIKIQKKLTKMKKKFNKIKKKFNVINKKTMNMMKIKNLN